ncbi:MAG TPA: CDP-alcohol phosphatidyltransferase family protein [Roseiflexaceae bacterium]|nr:CDP-alcohol phosphatidyltransferase family protein [Roseiflexaceae bacterium]
MFPETFTTKIRDMTGAVVARPLGRTSITASDLTIAGTLLTCGAAWLIATGHFVWGGLLVAFASSFDMLDGALARVKREASNYGAFLDSTLDRYSEAVIYFGLLYYYHIHQIGGSEPLLIYAIVTGSLLTSYIRARAEALGYDCKVGLLERPERIIVLVLGLLSGYLTIAFWVLAVLTHVTAIQRFVHVWGQGKGERPARRKSAKGASVIAEPGE